MRHIRSQTIDQKVKVTDKGVKKRLACGEASSCPCECRPMFWFQHGTPIDAINGCGFGEIVDTLYQWPNRWWMRSPFASCMKRAARFLWKIERFRKSKLTYSMAAEAGANNIRSHESKRADHTDANHTRRFPGRIQAIAMISSDTYGNSDRRGGTIRKMHVCVFDSEIAYQVVPKKSSHKTSLAEVLVCLRKERSSVKRICREFETYGPESIWWWLDPKMNKKGTLGDFGSAGLSEGTGSAVF